MAEYLNKRPDAGTPGEVFCLKCDKLWKSPDKRRIRICYKCKAGKDWKESSATDFLLPRNDVEALMRMPLSPQSVDPGDKGTAGL